jgi:hypothetical protein
MSKESPCVVINCGEEKHEHDEGVCEAAEVRSAFVGGVDIGFLSPVATEIPTELLINPAGSGKNLVVYLRQVSSLGSADETTLFKFYFDPTVTNNGTAASIVNLSTTAAALAEVPVAQLFSSPVITAPGKLIDLINSVASDDMDAMLVIAPGHSLLVTERTNAENVRAQATIYWRECREERMHSK